MKIRAVVEKSTDGAGGDGGTNPRDPKPRARRGIKPRPPTDPARNNKDEMGI